MVKNLVMSFQDYTLRTFFTGKAPWVGLQNYVTVVTDDVFTKAMVNTALFTIGSIAGQFVIGMLLALFFHKNFPLNGVLRALFLLPWLIPLIVGSAAWRAHPRAGQRHPQRHAGEPGDHRRPDPVAHLARRRADRGHPGEHLDRHPVQPDPALQRAAGHPGGAVRGGRAGRRDRWKAFWHITWPNLRAVVSVVLMLGVIYTLKVLDIILGLTQGGPANATQTIATQSYQRSFVEFKFGQGAALSQHLDPDLTGVRDRLPARHPAPGRRVRRRR